MTLMEAFVSGEENHLLGKYIDLNQYPFAALNTAYLEEGLFIRVGRASAFPGRWLWFSIPTAARFAGWQTFAT